MVGAGADPLSPVPLQGARGVHRVVAPHPMASRKYWARNSSLPNTPDGGERLFWWVSFVTMFSDVKNKYRTNCLESQEKTSENIPFLKS
jgi:hypothetical protein